MKTVITRAIALLLLLCMFPLALFSCSSDDTNNGTEPNASQESEAPTDKITDDTVSDTEKVTDKVDFLTVFKNGSYVSDVIRSEKASDNDKLAYNKLKSELKTKTGKAIIMTSLPTIAVLLGEISCSNILRSSLI